MSKGEPQTSWTEAAKDLAGAFGEQHGYMLSVECRRPSIPQCRIVDAMGSPMSRWYAEQIIVKMLRFAIVLDRDIRIAQQQEDATNA